ncbi:MAG: alpha-ribazole phosphatase [Actinobacteria bacterium]|nr:alpha-ribazole phosphatase [Actinomycetota bacterium]
MSRVILVRHGRTAWHAEGRYAGTADVELDEVGRKQVQLVVGRLADVDIECVYSSPLSRCFELAGRVAESHGLEVTVDRRLREIDLGRWDGKTYSEIIERDGEILRKWTADPSSVTVPGGESLTEVQERAMKWFSQVVAEHPEGTVLASSHGGPIRSILAAVIGLPLSKIFRLQVDLASISIVDYKGKYSNLELLNETCHLERS